MTCHHKVLTFFVDEHIYLDTSMAKTQITGGQVLDGTLTSDDIADSLELNVLSISDSLHLTGTLAQGSGSIASGSYSHAEGAGTTTSTIFTHAEGAYTAAGMKGFQSIDISLSVQDEIVLEASYGDVTGLFSGQMAIVIDTEYDNVIGYKTYSVNSTSFNSPNTILAFSTTIPFTTAAVIGIQGYPNPPGADINLGRYSHAEGNSTITAADYAHAEGSGTVAAGEGSHAEGGSGGGGTLVASGQYSHAEGYNTLASGSNSHAEGYSTIAAGYSSHAEGSFTVAIGSYSHAEGVSTIAFADYSHAEGEGTITSGSYQHAGGMYNVRGNDFSLFVIGNGTSDADVDRSDVLRVNSGSIGDGRVEVTGSLAATLGLSGSLTRLIDGTSYLIASGGANVTSSSNGAVTIFAPESTLPGGSSGEVQFNSAGIFSGSSLLKFNPTVGALTASYFVGNGGGLTQLTASQVYVSGAASIDGYLQLLSVGNVVIPTNQAAGYMYVSGSTNDIYFTQYQPDTNLSNTTRLRWLEGALTTGLLHGGVLSTQNGTTSFSITSGSGIIVSYNASTGSEPYPTVKLITWPTYLSQSLTYVTSSFISYIGINPSGGIIQQTSPLSLTADADYITIGRVLHQSGSVTSGVATTPAVAYGVNSWQDDFTRAIGPLKVNGHVLATSSSAGVGTLGLTKTTGDSYVIGRNYTSNPNSPNVVTSVTDLVPTTCKIYRQHVSGSTTVLDTGVANVGYTVIDPDNYNNNGTLSAVTGGRYTIQRVFWFPNSVNRAFYVYYGGATYNSLDTAQQNIASEQFLEGENTAGAAILLGYVLVRGGATDLTSTSQARIIQAGVSRGAGAGGGGGVAVGATSPGGIDTYVQFNDGGSTFGGDAGLTYNKTTDTLTIGNISIGDPGLVSTTGTTVNLFNTTATTVNFAGGASTALKIGNSSGTNTISGSTTFVNPGTFSQGLSGSLTKLADGTSYLVAGSGVSIASGSNGSVTISTTGVDDFFDSTTTGSIFTTGSVAFRGGELSLNSPANKGTDVFFYVSGSQGSKDGVDPGVTLFGGDVVVSGTFYSTVGSALFSRVKETFNSISGSSSTMTFDCSTGHIFYGTTPSSNFTANFINLSLGSGYATALTLVLSQSSTPYIPTAVQIGGVGQQLNWQGSSQPSGTANKKDIVSFSILNSSSSYIVLGQLTSFG